jgi:two-component system sensor histidine kinase RegB
MAQAVRRLRWLMLGAALQRWRWPRCWPCSCRGLLVQALATLAVLNFALRHWPLPPRSQLALGLFGDVLVLSEVLAFSGGAANPLASLYLPPVLLAALLLPPRQAWLLALLSLGGYALLFGWHLPWPLAGDDAAYAFRCIWSACG